MIETKRNFIKNILISVASRSELRENNASKYTEVTEVDGTTLPVTCIFFPSGSQVNYIANNTIFHYTFYSTNKAEIFGESELMSKMGHGNAFREGNASDEQIERLHSILPPLFHEYATQLGKTGSVSPCADISHFLSESNDQLPQEDSVADSDSDYSDHVHLTKSKVSGYRKMSKRMRCDVECEPKVEREKPD
ncbi:hypothetical protein ACOME3_003750 [Neoechinorhynchus agilis]